MSSLSKSISRASGVLKLRSSFRKSECDKMSLDLFKGCHDAMSHHSSYAKAAEMKGKKEAAKKHTFMFLRHALENSRGAKDSYGMKDKLRKAIEYFDSDSYNDLGYDASNDNHPACKHFKSNDNFVPHKDDKFKEDYDVGESSKKK